MSKIYTDEVIESIAIAHISKNFKYAHIKRITPYDVLSNFSNSFKFILGAERFKGLTLKQYEHFLRSDPEYLSYHKAKNLALRILDEEDLILVHDVILGSSYKLVPRY